MPGPRVTWLGHAGFKIETEHEGQSKVIYIDTWTGNPKFPDSVDRKITDADLVLVTHGHFDHSESSNKLILQSTKKDAKLVANFEIVKYFLKKRMDGVPEENVSPMNKSGTVDFGFCRVTMVSADHSSSCGIPEGDNFEGGAAGGFIIRFPGTDVTIYHAGDTGVFGDM